MARPLAYTTVPVALLYGTANDGSAPPRAFAAVMTGGMGGGVAVNDSVVPLMLPRM